MARFFTTHQEVQRLQRECGELGTLVDPGDRARAVTGGCLAKILAAVGGLAGFVISMTLGFLIAEHAHALIAVVVAITGGVVSLMGCVLLANSAMAALYRRAITRAVEPPQLGGVSSGSSAAIPTGRAGDPRG